MPRRIFIVGKQGQLARALAQTYAEKGDVVVNVGRPSVDITRAEAVRTAVADFRPELVINAAAYTGVDKAEEETHRAFSINRDGARHIAAAARSAAAPLIQISTDYVFDGTKTAP